MSRRATYGGEPLLVDLMNDPVMHLMMQADRVTHADLQRVSSAARSTLAGAGGPGMAVPGAGRRA